MNNTIAILISLDRYTSQFGLGLLFVLGVISTTLNTITFTRKTFRNTSCVLYFLSSTIANYPIIYFVIPSRFLADGFNIDPSVMSSSFCKIREYILTVSRSLSAWFIVLASFDRLMSSSTKVHYRQFCRMHRARTIIVLTTLFGILFYVPIPVLFTNHGLNNQCEALQPIYQIINDSIFSICYILTPAFLMLNFGFLTVYNRRRRQRVIVPAFRSLSIVKRDRNLFLMFIFQFVLFTFTTVPFGIVKLYVTTTTKTADDLQLAKNNFLIILTRTISFINHSCQFYIFVLSSKLFRRELEKSIQQFIESHPALMRFMHAMKNVKNRFRAREIFE